MNKKITQEIKTYIVILLGSVLYAAGTVLFIFPNSLLLGGISGVSVILNKFLPFSPGTLLTVINMSLIVVAFIVLGRDMAVKTLVGSVLTTLSIPLLEKTLVFDAPLISNHYISAVVGALLISVASGMLFYVNSSSGGTDVISLIVQKYSGMNIGKAVLVTDILIVVVGGALSGLTIAISSFIGLLVKTFGIDGVIALIKRLKKDGGTYEK
ncbi:MAG: YitT family protein [Ruminococcaceae bacterium]|nr:YitT family protein [Oscillospiraceae bacterium]